jgi:hypothetical protein
MRNESATSELLPWQTIDYDISPISFQSHLNNNSHFTYPDPVIHSQVGLKCKEPARKRRSMTYTQPCEKIYIKGACKNAKFH